MIESQLSRSNRGSVSRRSTVEILHQKLDEALRTHMNRMRAADEELDDIQLAVVRRREFALTEIWAARERVDKGTYGICESCLGNISLDRLHTIPYARLCVDCATLPEAG
jgi:RNA polymerase-binding transcription factor DksA